MARAKRANHRSGTERPRWVLGGLGGPHEADWEPDDPAVDDASGTEGYRDRPGPEGEPVNGHNGWTQNGAAQGGADTRGDGRLGQVGQIGRPGQNGRAGHSGLTGQNGSDGQDGRNGLNGQVGMNAQPHDGHTPQQGQDPQDGKSTPAKKAPAGKKALATKDRQAGDKSQDSENPQNSDTPENTDTQEAGDPPIESGQPDSAATGTDQNDQVPQVGYRDRYPQRPDRAAQLRYGEFGTPVRVDEIAVAAIALSENLQAATKDLPESVESRQYRRDLDEAADTFRSVASELETTASNLIRLAAQDGQSCGVTWGVCPEHGITLMNFGDVVTCHVLGCHREQEGVAEACTQPVAYKVVDAAGPALFTCAGHAIACRLHLEGAVITLASDSLELL